MEIEVLSVDATLAAKVLQGLPVLAENSRASQELTAFDLTPAQRVLSLADTLDVIFTHIPLLTKSDRDTFHHAALTSHAFHGASQLRLWRRPRDLDTVEQQVRFAFGTAISGAVSDSLGLYVKRLRIRIVKGGWNFRLVEKIAALATGVVDLPLHWGDSVDGQEPVTSALVASLNTTLSSFPNLKHLYLGKFASTPEVEGELNFPSGAHLPFSKLESLQLYDFHWYWQAIAAGLGANLKTLDVGYGTLIDNDQLVELSEKLTSLTTLRVGSGILEVRHIRVLVERLPSLEHVDITNYSEVDDEYVVAAIPVLASLEKLKVLDFNGAIGSTQLKVLENSAAPLEEISLKVKVDSQVAEILEKLLTAKRETLKAVKISCEDKSIVPSDKLVHALAGIPNLERILIDFDDSQQLSSTSIGALLKQCPKLELTDSLEVLVLEDPLYENEYRARLEKERDQDIEEMGEDILGN